MNNDYLREADHRVMEHLQELFSFEGHKHSVYDTADPESREFIETVESELGHSLSHDFLKSDAISLTHKDKESGELGYSVVMLNVDREHYLLHLGDELIQCEHAFAHGEAEEQEAYENIFHRAFRSMLGTLGMHSVHENLYKPEERPGFWADEPGKGSVLSVPNYIGFQLAMQLAESGMEIPYKELFWAQDHTEGMRIFTGIAKPMVALIGKQITKQLRAELIGAFVAMGLDTSVLSFGKNSNKD